MPTNQPPPPPQQESYGIPQESYGVPLQQPQYGGPPPQQQQPFDPNHAAGALVLSQQPSNPYAQPPPPAYGADPNYYGHQQQQQYPPPTPVDPFSVFEKAPAPSTFEQQQIAVAPISNAMVPHQPPVAAADSNDDFWSNFTPEQAADNSNAASKPGDQVDDSDSTDKTGPTRAAADSTADLPEGGEWYDARIFTPTLGVMFFKPHELTDSLFLNTEKSLVDALDQRPVVAFIVEGSSARSAGVELGHVLVKVNGIDVSNPKEASRLIKEGPRPLPLLFYVPNTEVVTAEGEHMVKYDTKETDAPSSSKDWKPKYVVIGGIIAQPWMINMYRSKVRVMKERWKV
jgi:hypothetical protein